MGTGLHVARGDAYTALSMATGGDSGSGPSQNQSYSISVARTQSPVIVKVSRNSQFIRPFFGTIMSIASLVKAATTPRIGR